MRAGGRTVSPRRESPAARGFWSEAMAIVLMAIAVLLVLSLGSYRADDPVPWPLGHWSDEPVHNVVGITGALSAELLRQLFGYASWAVPPLLLLLGWEIFWRRSGRALSRSFGSLLLVLSAAACLHLVLDGGPGPEIRSAGGWFGLSLAHFLARPLNRWGALVVGVALFATSLLVVTLASIVEAARILWARGMAGLPGGWLAGGGPPEAGRQGGLPLAGPPPAK